MWGVSKNSFPTGTEPILHADTRKEETSQKQPSLCNILDLVTYIGISLHQDLQGCERDQAWVSTPKKWSKLNPSYYIHPLTKKTELKPRWSRLTSCTTFLALWCKDSQTLQAEPPQHHCSSSSEKVLILLCGQEASRTHHQQSISDGSSENEVLFLTATLPKLWHDRCWYCSRWRYATEGLKNLHYWCWICSHSCCNRNLASCFWWPWLSWAPRPHNSSIDWPTPHSPSLP